MIIRHLDDKVLVLPQTIILLKFRALMGVVAGGEIVVKRFGVLVAVVGLLAGAGCGDDGDEGATGEPRRSR